MDNLYGISDSKLPKRGSMSPIQNFGTQNPYFHYKTPVIDQYPSPDGHITSFKTVNSPLLRYLQSSRSLLATPSSIGDHQSSIGYKYHRNSVTRGSDKSPRVEPPHRPRSPLLFRNTAVKVEEDVLVMDGVVLKNPPVDRGKSSSSSLPDSSSSSSSSLSSPGSNNYKMDLCVSYLEKAGYCRYGTKCQFAHGNKELRASQFPYKTILETPCKNYNISAAMSPMKIEEFTTNIASFKTTDWTPLDDDIEIQKGNGDTFSKHDIDAYINKFLHGSKKSKRLPVFTAIFLE
ncbi:unnamed protein product [Lactuca saligna]|uniref:C3H1-type domain-containing protein n=1 Tax=Lactuca saligna TaxID=75948 RepID=A0AA35ZLC7_LACSI|nr:unnamed protein product [Lactuca saligna]